MFMEMPQTQLLSKSQQSTVSRAQCLIDQKELLKNLCYYQGLLDDKTNVLAILKADAYALGLDLILPFLIGQGLKWVGVVTMDEALAVRALDKTIGILLLSEPCYDSLYLICEENISFLVYSLDFLSTIESFPFKEKLRMHLKINTGMNRLGLTDMNLDAFFEKLDQLDLSLEGVCSHFLGDQLGCKSNEMQFELFSNHIKKIGTFCNISDLLIHFANTKAVLSIPKSCFNMIRIGLGLYKNSISIQTQIHRVFKSCKDLLTIGYNATYQIKPNCVIAVAEFGYADGMPTQLANVGSVLIRGELYPIVGKVSMDWFMINLGENHQGIQAGDTVSIISAKHKTLNLESVSKLSGLNPRELLCHLGPRVERKLIKV